MDSRNKKILIGILCMSVTVNCLFIFQFIKYKNKYEKLQDEVAPSMVAVGKDDNGEIEYKEAINGKVYLLEGRGERWSLRDMIYIHDSGKQTFLNGYLNYDSFRESDLDSYSIKFYLMNDNGEIGKYLYSQVGGAPAYANGYKDNSHNLKLMLGSQIYLFENLEARRFSLPFDFVIDEETRFCMKVTYVNEKGKEITDEIIINVKEFYWE